MCSRPKQIFPSTHPKLGPLQPLLGTFAGEGKGVYPTIAPFAYLEESSFIARPGKPFIEYTQYTSKPMAPFPTMHLETGYIRPGADETSWEMVVSDPTGVAQTYDGILTRTEEKEGFTLVFTSKEVTTTTTAKEVKSLTRTFTLSADLKTLSCEVEMAAVGQPLQNHLTATLSRTPIPPIPGVRFAFAPPSGYFDALSDEGKGTLKEGKVRLIDVREKDEYEASHLPGAENYPMGAFVRDMEELDWDKESLIVLHCRTGSRASICQRLLIAVCFFFPFFLLLLLIFRNPSSSPSFLYPIPFFFSLYWNHPLCVFLSLSFSPSLFLSHTSSPLFCSSSSNPSRTQLHNSPSEWLQKRQEHQRRVRRSP